jgi:WD40 repeat protein
VAFDPAGKLMASGGRDGRVVVRAFPGGEEVLRLPADDAPRDLAEIPLMATLSAGSPEIAALLLRGELNPAELRMRGRPSKLGEVMGLSWSPDGSRLVTAGDGSYVRIWSMPEGKLEGVIPVSHARPVFYSPDGRLLVVVRADFSGARQHQVRIYRTEDLSLVRAITGVEPCAAFSPDGKWLVSGGNDHGTRLWNLEPAGPAGVVELPVAPVTPADELRAAGPDGVWVGGGKRFDPITLEAPAGNTPIRRIVGPSGLYLRLIAVPDGKQLAAFSWPRDLLIAELPEGKWRAPLRLSEGTVGPIVFSRDGRTLASGGDDNVITVRDMPGGAVRAVLRGHREQLVSLAFSPDGRTLASASADGTVRLWDADGGRPVASRRQTLWSATGRPHTAPPPRYT